MITKVTKDNKALYRALFERATTDLATAHPGEAAVTISSLDDYFLSIKDLTDLNGGDNTYAILPLDEPFFEINANTRVITVPSEFKTNGISVKGDQIAEILFFTIDRYYDTVDLFDPSVKIFIQCESPDGIQHVYREFLRDVSLFKSQGKMVFGWTIDNKITKQSGVLKFSVRFIKAALNDNEENEIIFSLSTLTANATINPGLDFTFNGDDPEVELIDNKNIIKKRIINSTPTADNGDVEIAYPVFFIDIPTQASDIFLSEEGEDMNGETVTFENVDLDLNGQYKFSVMATSEDGGLITYDWYRASIGADLSSHDALNAVDEYVETEDTVWGSEHPYYTQSIINNIPSYTVKQIPASDIGQEIPEEGGPYYEKRSTYTATEVGNYWVVAKNRIGNSIKTTNSTYVRIPGPEELNVTVINDATENEETHVLQVLLDSEGAFELEAKGATARVGQAGEAGDKITYTWYEIPTEGDAIVVKNETKSNNNSSTYTQSIESNDVAKFDKTFKVSVVASRNGAYTQEADVIANAKVFRVTDSAHAPIVLAHEQEAVIRGADGNVTLSVDMNLSAIIYDELTYQWYRITLNSEDEDFLIDGATEPTLTVDAADSYYCLVTNHINGSTATSARPDPDEPNDRAKYTVVTKRT